MGSGEETSGEAATAARCSVVERLCEAKKLKAADGKQHRSLFSPLTQPVSHFDTILAVPAAGFWILSVQRRSGAREGGRGGPV